MVAPAQSPPRQRLLSTTSLLRQAIREASSHQDLQRRLLKLQSPGLRPADRATPLPKLRSELLAGVEQVEARIWNRFGGQKAPRAELVIFSLLPSLLTSLLLALIFPVIGRPHRGLNRFGEKTYFESISPQDPPEHPGLGALPTSGNPDHGQQNSGSGSTAKLSADI